MAVTTTPRYTSVAEQKAIDAREAERRHIATAFMAALMPTIANDNSPGTGHEWASVCVSAAETLQLELDRTGPNSKVEKGTTP